jgi:hypothetical protein
MASNGSGKSQDAFWANHNCRTKIGEIMLMLEQWVIDKLSPLKGEKLIIIADPQRMIRAGAQAVDGWARDNGFTVLFCSGNLALREMYENLRNDKSAKIILVDRTRQKAKLPLFYPDLEARCKPKARMTITLKDFLTEQTGDPRWPSLVNSDRNLSRLILDHQGNRGHSALQYVGGELECWHATYSTRITGRICLPCPQSRKWS